MAASEESRESTSSLDEEARLEALEKGVRRRQGMCQLSILPVSLSSAWLLCHSSTSQLPQPSFIGIAACWRVHPIACPPSPRLMLLHICRCAVCQRRTEESREAEPGI